MTRLRIRLRRFRGYRLLRRAGFDRRMALYGCWYGSASCDVGEDGQHWWTFPSEHPPAIDEDDAA